MTQPTPQNNNTPEADILPPPIKGTFTVFRLLFTQAVFILLGFGIYTYSLDDTPFMWASLLGDPIGGLIIGVLLSVCLIISGILMGLLLPRLTNALNDHIADLYTQMGLKLGWPTILAISFAAGICEEMIFRAGLIGGLFSPLHPLLALFLSSSIFALFHATSRLYFGLTFIIGCILGGVFILTGNLIGVIFAHIIYDIWALRRLRPHLTAATYAISPTSQSP